MKPKWLFAAAASFSVLLLVWLASASAKAPTPQSISGYVLASNGDPIEKVSVDLTPTSHKDKAMHTTTDSRGHYEITKIEYTGAYDISYSFSGMDVSVVSLLSEQKGDQIVNKVLYRFGEARSALAIHESLQSLERLHALRMAAGGEDGNPYIQKLVVQFTGSALLDKDLKISDADERKEKLVRSKQRAVLQLLSEQR